MWWCSMFDILNEIIIKKIFSKMKLCNWVEKNRKLCGSPKVTSHTFVSFLFHSFTLFKQRNHIYTFHIQRVSHCVAHTKWANVFNYSENLVKGNERNGSEWNKLQTCKTHTKNKPNDKTKTSHNYTVCYISGVSIFVFT